MPRKLLQWVGALFVLGLFGASMAALAIVKDRVRVVVQQDDVAAGPDPVALLRDDLQSVVREVAELRSALAASFERLGTALEERADARHGDVQALAREVAALRKRADATHAEVVRLQARWQEPAARAAVESARPAVADAVPPPSSPPSSPPTAASAGPAEVPVPAAATDGKPTDGRPKTGFLSFSIPSATFRFDEPAEYALVPDLCRVGFDAKSTLHDFSGVTSKVAGRFTADLDDPQGAWTGEISCEAGTLLTGVEGRDANMWEHLDAKNHPRIRFAITRFVPAEGGIDAGKQTARGDVVGTMTIRGVSRDLRMPVTVEVDPSRRLVVKGQVPLKLSDYGVPVPSQLGVINMQDEVVVWVALRARANTGGSK